MIDDATSRALARFAPQDSTAENLRLVWAWLAKYGRFVDGYTDRAGLFETNRPNQRDAEGEGAHDGSGQRLYRARVFADVERALHGAASQRGGCSSADGEGA